jgi:hypothetical protein
MDGTLLRDGPAAPELASPSTPAHAGPRSPTAFADPWLKVWREAGAWNYGLMTVAVLVGARQMRKSWLADLTRTADSFLRSPAFLELVRGGPGVRPLK